MWTWVEVRSVPRSQQGPGRASIKAERVHGTEPRTGFDTRGAEQDQANLVPAPVR